jgi:preprotein translocase subunit SecY
MASAAEQLAASINFKSFAKAKDLKRRILFTVIALIVYRLGTYIPCPGIDASVLEMMFRQHQGGILGIFDTFAGGALSRMSVFALNIMPYISASIIIQLMTAAIPSWEAMKKEGESGRKTLNQYTRYLTVILAGLQAYAIAVGLEGMRVGNAGAVHDVGIFFRVTTVVTLVGGTVFLMWLGEQITERGIGNGTSMLIFAGIVAGLPTGVVHLLSLGQAGAIQEWVILLIFVLAIAVVMLIVFFERAQRKVLVHHPRRQVGNKVYGGESTHLPLKLNTAGVIPPIFASSLLVLPITILGFRGGANAPEWLTQLTAMLGHGQPLYLAIYATLIVFFAYFYTAIVFNPMETAENLRKSGAFIPGIRPGKNTATYFDAILTRITAVGAFYLVGICLLPEFLIAQFSLPFYFGGTSLLIVVSVTMDTVAQIHSHLLANQYEGLLKKSKLRGRKA